jgi:hypothetical protein
MSFRQAPPESFLSGKDFERNHLRICSYPKEGSFLLGHGMKHK